MSRVLITDDSLLQRRALSAIVADAGHEVDTACNGQEAIEKIQATPSRLPALGYAHASHGWIASP